MNATLFGLDSNPIRFLVLLPNFFFHDCFSPSSTSKYAVGCGIVSIVVLKHLGNANNAT